MICFKWWGELCRTRSLRTRQSFYAVTVWSCNQSEWLFLPQIFNLNSTNHTVAFFSHSKRQTIFAIKSWKLQPIMGRSASRFHRDVSNLTAWSPSKIQTRAAIDMSDLIFSMRPKKWQSWNSKETQPAASCSLLSTNCSVVKYCKFSSC